MLIARLIADPDLLGIRLDALLSALESQAMPVARAVMLEHCGEVLQLELPKCDVASLRKAVDEHLGPTDGLVAPDLITLPNLFVSDMDSTMIGQECIDELADFAGLKDQVSEITERAMLGELDFESALRERVGLLAGLDEIAIQRCLEERIRPTPGARVLVETLKSKGCHTVLVTGGFHHFADVVAEILGFDQVVGNRLAVADGALTGELAGPVVDSGTKKSTLEAELSKLSQSARSLTAGDGANDIPMIAASNYGFAYRAKPKAREAANGWIDRGDLTSVLKLLDIPQVHWAT